MDTDGGGWEVVWKNAGGPQRPQTTMSNLQMRAQSALRVDMVTMPLDVTKDQKLQVIPQWCQKITI